MTMRQIAPPPADVQDFAHRGTIYSGADFNDATRSGTYYFNGTKKNSPVSTDWYGYIIVFAGSSNSILQIVVGNYGTAGSRMFTRSYNNGKWGAWASLG